MASAVKHGLFFAVGLFMVAMPAASHDIWANGETVPAWVKRACCGIADAHHIVDESAVHEMPDGFHIDGYQHVIPYAKALPSPDGTIWLFFGAYSDGTQSDPYCFFYGVKGS